MSSTADTPEYSTNIQLSAYPQIDENRYPDIYTDLTNVHSAIRLLQQYLDSYTGARFVGRTSVPINTAQFVAVTTSSDLATLLLADNTDHTKPCIGFCTGGQTTGNGIEIQTTGIWPYGSGQLSPGTVYYLGTAGTITPTLPAGAGKLVQEIGIALDTDNLLFKPASKYIEL